MEINSDRSLLERALIEPVFVLAAFTAWLYLFGIAYLAGYLGHFGGSPSWFDPSIFRLVSFSLDALLIAALPAALYLVLWYTISEVRAIWKVTYAIWVLYFLGIGGYYAFVRFVELNPFGRNDYVGALVNCVAWAAAPLWLLYCYRLAYRTTNRIKASEKSVLQADSLTTELRAPGAHTSSFFDKLTLRHAWVFPLCVCAWAHISVSGWLGSIAAHLKSEQLVAISNTRAKMLGTAKDFPPAERFASLIPTQYMLFTDGDNRLAATIASGESPKYWLYSGDDAILLTSPALLRHGKMILDGEIAELKRAARNEPSNAN